MSVPYCSNCLERISNCECDGDYPHIFGEHRVDDIKTIIEIYKMVEDNRIEETSANSGIWDDGMTGYNEAVEDILAELRAKLVEMNTPTIIDK